MEHFFSMCVFFKFGHHGHVFISFHVVCIHLNPNPNPRGTFQREFFSAAFVNFSVSSKSNRNKCFLTIKASSRCI
jgi:hypothetical protein